MKNIFLSNILLFSILTIQAQIPSITETEACIVARNFYFERISQYRSMAYDHIEIRDVTTVRTEGIIVYYVVNLNDQGFVIVSGVRSVIPVLGYSFDSQYDGTIQACNFTSWMDHYQEQILDCIAIGCKGSKENDQAWERLLTNDPDFLTVLKKERGVEPLLTSTWNQDYPYNTHCPADPAGPHGHCLAGCVATAMGQLLYYYRWPITGTGSYTYIHPDYGEITADFSAATYDWEQMTNATAVPNDAISELLFHLGVSVDMDYGPSSSGMWNHKAAYSLKTYFNYSPETQYVFRDSTSMDWDSLVIAHLDRAMPCYYAGWADYTYTSGHAFVVDGYQGGDYFHMNWGWGGAYDGYFYLDNLTPGGNNFNYAQELIINSFPDTLNYTYPVYCQGDTFLNAPAGSLGDGSGPVYNYSNGSGCSWLIDPQTGQDSITNVTLTFHRFTTEPGDTLSVYDGPSTDDPLLGRFSGTILPGTTTSSGNQMLITFSSDEEIQSGGWFATYSTTSPVWCSGITVLTDGGGIFEDGSGSFNYQNNSLCQWRIMPPGAYNIELFFNTFETEEGQDFLKVYDLQTQTLLGQFSGSTLPGNVFCPSGKMLIMFSSDDQNTASGWEAGYATNVYGIDNPDSGFTLDIYPVPASGVLNIRISNRGPENLSMHLLNPTGQTVRTIEAVSIDGEISVALDISGLQKGPYFLRIYSSGRHVCRKVIIY